ncbi:ferric reductase-like transmembrane domain-containing protein [Caenispirillum salinarum]|uniref:ferric reductase-like transmembrane domain-containing protein n=1 Tax=Caenispirillum salinarum TaxID=859058 RepID=UPI00384D538B
MNTATLAAAPRTTRLARAASGRPEVWLGLPWLAAFFAVVAWQAWLGFTYDSNDTTNIFLQIGRAAAYALLPVLAVMWLPVLRNVTTVVEASRFGRFLPLEGARAAHRWLGHLLMALALIHGSQYLVYFGTLNAPFTDVLFGEEPDLVRSMRTTMYDYVTDDADIATVERWIGTGMPVGVYETEVHPIIQRDCAKCHNPTATRSYAVNHLPMTNYEEVVSWARQGVESRQFRIVVSGLLMLVLFAALWATSLAAVRRRAHHVYQVTHRLGYVAALLALLHIPSLSWIVAPILVLVVEVYLSRHRRLYRNRPATLTRFSDGMLRMNIARPQGMTIAAGHYVQVRVRDFGSDEWHAFSLTGHPEEGDDIVLKIRVAGDWTQQLDRLVADRTERRLEVDVRGPFASPAAQALQRRDWLLVAGGVGFAPFLGLLRHLASADEKPRHVHVVWAMRDASMLKWIEPVAERLASTRGISLHWHVYLTGDAAKMPAIEAPADIAVQRGRPDWPHLLDRIAEGSPSLSCFICAPRGMIEDVAGRCRSRGWAVRTELFAG